MNRDSELNRNPVFHKMDNQTLNVPGGWWALLRVFVFFSLQVLQQTAICHREGVWAGENRQDFSVAWFPPTHPDMCIFYSSGV